MSDINNVSLNSIQLPLFITKIKVIQAKLIEEDYLEITNLSGETLIGVKGDWILNTEDDDNYILDKHSFINNYEPLNNLARESINKFKLFEQEKKNNSIMLAYYGELRDIFKNKNSSNLPKNNKEEGDI